MITIKELQMEPKEIHICSFCGKETGIQIYSDAYVNSLKKQIEHLKDVQEHIVGAKEMSVSDAERLLRGFINSQGYDYLERILHIIKLDLKDKQ